MSNSPVKTSSFLPLYFPWLLSALVQSNPVLSYWFAWAGSFFIFYYTLISSNRTISKDMPLYEQIMRPIFLTQIIFAGFMCCTSVFYFLDHMGYVYLEKVYSYDFIPNDKTLLIAECQRLSVLGHAALAHGMIYLIPTNTPIKKYRLSANINSDNFLIYISIGTYVLGFFVRNISSIAQFSGGLLNTAIISGAFLMVKGVFHKKINLLLIGGSLFITNFIASSLSGFKEHIFVNFLIIGCLLYPYYRRTTVVIGLPILYGLFYILPTYVKVIRAQSWGGQTTAEKAQSEALETIFDNGNSTAIDDTNWDFLTGRLSEIEMFTLFVESTPNIIPYYGFEIVTNSIQALVPRVLWPNKPITESVAMERVYNAGVVERTSLVSAKTRPIVDAYLSWGTFGVFICLFFFGLITQAICNKAESLFGGYQLGCIIIFNGLFQQLWRGNNFEFIGNSVFWSFVLMLIIFQLLKAKGILIPTNNLNESLNQKFL